MIKRNTSVQALDRALILLEIIALHENGIRLSDLARETDLAITTVHRLLTTLEGRSFVQLDPMTMHWHIGSKAFTVGISFSNWKNFIASAIPFMRRLRDITRETTNLGVLENGHVITVAQVESRELIRALAMPGGGTPVMNSGMGKSIVATWPDAEIEALVMRHGLRPLTAHSLRSMQEVHADINTIRSRGYAYDNEEFSNDMRCIAAVVWAPNGEPLGAISISAHIARMPLHKMDETGRLVKSIADELSSSLISHS